MHSSELTAKITSLVLPLAESLGLTLWGVEVAIGPRGIVRIFVENATSSGVSVEDCAELSRLAGLTLEVEDLMPCAYLLEVSSPGIERVFFTERQLSAAVGKKIEMSLLAPKPAAPGRRKFRGTLASAEKGVFTIVVDELVRAGQAPLALEFRFEDLKKVRLVDANQQTPPEEKKQTKRKGSGDKKTTQPKEEPVVEEELRPLTPEEEELLAIIGGSEAL